MSTKQFLRSGLMAAAGLSALGLTACANSNAATGAYGVSHMDYEYNAACAPQGCGPVVTPTYTPAPVAPVVPAAPFTVTHMDYEGRQSCYQPTCASAGFSSTVTTGYSAGIAAPTYSTEIAECPAGTTAQPDGTCMQTGSHISTTYTGSSYVGSSYSSGSYSSGSVYSSGEVAACPAGTTSQPDGTCLQSGSSSYSSYSSSYTAPTTTSTYSSTYSAPPIVIDCDAVGTCGGQVTGTTSNYGYATSGSSYGDYLPIRK